MIIDICVSPACGFEQLDAPLDSGDMRRVGRAPNPIALPFFEGLEGVEGVVLRRSPVVPKYLPLS